MPPTDDTDDLRQKLTHAEAVIAELRGVVAELRKQIEAQQAHIHRLVKITFGRGGERVEGPTLFDGIDRARRRGPDAGRAADPRSASRDEAEGPRSAVQAEGPAASPRGDRPERRREGLCVLRHGQDPHRPDASANASTTSRWRSSSANWSAPPTPAGRASPQGHDPQIARAVLPPEPIPKSGIGAGLLAHVIVSKIVDHLPLHRQESILARHGWDVRRSTLCDHLRKCGATADAALRPDAPTPAAVVRDPRRRHAAGAPAAATDRLRLGLPRRRRRIRTRCSTSPPAGARPSRRRSSPATAASSTPTPTTATTRCTATSGISAAGCTPDGTSSRPSRATRGRSRPWPSSAPSTPSNARSRTNGRSSASRFTDADVVRLRRTRAGPILARFADWLERAAPPRDAEEPVRSGRRVLPEPVGVARPVPRRRAVRHRQRGGRAGHPSAGRRPGQLAARRRRRRVADRLRAAERLRQCPAAPPQPVGVPDARPDRLAGPPRRGRPRRPAPGPVGRLPCRSGRAPVDARRPSLTVATCRRPGTRRAVVRPHSEMWSATTSPARPVDQSSFRIVPMPRFLVNSELLLLPNRSR